MPNVHRSRPNGTPARRERGARGRRTSPTPRGYRGPASRSARAFPSRRCFVTTASATSAASARGIATMPSTSPDDEVAGRHFHAADDGLDVDARHDRAAERVEWRQPAGECREAERLDLSRIAHEPVDDDAGAPRPIAAHEKSSPHEAAEHQARPRTSGTSPGAGRRAPSTRRHTAAPAPRSRRRSRPARRPRRTAPPARAGGSPGRGPGRVVPSGRARRRRRRTRHRRVAAVTSGIQRGRRGSSHGLARRGSPRGGRRRSPPTA